MLRGNLLEQEKEAEVRNNTIEELQSNMTSLDRVFTHTKKLLQSKDEEVTSQHHTIIGLRGQIASKNETIKTSAAEAWKDRKVANGLIHAANKLATDEADNAREKVKIAEGAIMHSHQEVSKTIQAERAVTQAKIDSVRKQTRESISRVQRDADAIVAHRDIAMKTMKTINEECNNSLKIAANDATNEKRQLKE